MNRIWALTCLVFLPACNASTNASENALLPTPTDSPVTTQTPGAADTNLQLVPVPYDELFSDQTAARSLTGTAIILPDGQTRMQIAPVTGSIGSQGRQFTSSDTLYTLVDADGRDGSGNYSDGTVIMQTGTSEYDYARRYGAVYNVNGRREAAVGVFGIATSASDMPSSGTAKFLGTGEITETYTASALSASGPVNTTATAVLDVNFETGSVNAALIASGLISDPNSQIDRMSARGMSLNGSGFSGLNVKMFNSGTRVYPTGVTPTNQASGQFYGAKRKTDGTLTPAEVGAVMHSSGPDGIVFGSFLAK